MKRKLLDKFFSNPKFTWFLVFGLCLLVCATLTFQILLAKRSNPNLSTRSLVCGPISLAVSANLIGVPLDPTNAIEKCEITSEGTRFRDLKELAESYNLTATLLTISWAELAKFDTTCVLHVNGNHFIAVDPRKKESHANSISPQKKMWIYDTNDGGQWITKTDLERIWDGACLKLELLSDNRIEYSSIYTDSFWIDKGLLISTPKAIYDVPFLNVSDKPLSIKIASTSCSCSTATLNKTMIEPGGKVEMHAEVSLEGKRGPFKERVYIETSDSNTPPIGITLAGSVYNSSLLSTEKLFLGQLNKGQSFEKNVIVRDPGDHSLKLLECKVDSADRESLVGIIYSVSFKRLEDHQQLTELSAKWGQVAIGDYIVCVKGEISNNCPNGPSTFNIQIQTNLPNEFSNLTLPVKYEVLPDIYARPSAILISGMETDEVFINLFQRDKSSINIDSISIEGNLPIEAKLLKNDNQVCTISVKNNIINDASFENGRTANIVIHTQRGDYLTVPVVCNKQFD